MKRRWLIRIIFMLPVLLCVGGWGWSGTHKDFIVHVTGDRHWMECDSVMGYVRVGWGICDGPQEGWEFMSACYDESHFWPRPNEAICFLGFGYTSYADLPYRSATNVAVPYWFLIIIFSLLLFFVWRKTGKPKPGRAFPVEVGLRNDSAGG